MGFDRTLALDLGICDEHFSPFFLTIYSLKVAALVVLIEMIQCHVRMEAQALVAHSSPSQIYSTNMVTSLPELLTGSNESSGLDPLRQFPVILSSASV